MFGGRAQQLGIWYLLLGTWTVYLVLARLAKVRVPLQACARSSKGTDTRFSFCKSIGEIEVEANPWDDCVYPSDEGSVCVLLSVIEG